MLKSIHPQSCPQEVSGGNIPVVSLNQASPAKIVAQVAGGNAVKTAHPFLQSTVVGIDVLDMIDTRNDTLAGCQIDGAVGDVHLFGDGCQRLCPIGALNDISRQERLEHRTDVLLVSRLQHEVRSVSCPVSADQHSGLLFRSAAFAGFAAPLAGRSLQSLPSALLRLKEVRFVYLGNPRQAHGLLAVGQLQEPVVPAESSVGMYPDGGGAFTYARSFRQLHPVFNPLRFVPQTRQRRVGQGVEGRLTSAATIALQA